MELTHTKCPLEISAFLGCGLLLGIEVHGGDRKPECILRSKLSGAEVAASVRWSEAAADCPVLLENC